VRENPDVVERNRLATCRRRWSLRLGERLAGGFRSDVYTVVRADGTDAVLKLCATLEEAHAEVAALKAWTGSGASVALLDSDDRLGAMLLERLHPGTPMPRGENATVHVAAAMLSALHARHSHGFAFREVAGSFPSHQQQALDDLAYERRHRGEPHRALAAEQALPAAGALMERMAADTSRKVLLHGDFLTKNLLRAGDGYRAIDPIPRLGDPCADVGMFATDQPASIIMDTAADMARILGVDIDRAAAWSVVWSVMQTAQAWREDQEELDTLVQSTTFRGILDG
jgi:streptomycin 6-kinase